MVSLKWLNLTIIKNTNTMAVIKYESSVGFTVEDLQKIFADPKLKSAKVYNSCMYADYTQEQLEKSIVKDFEPIDGIFVEYGIIASYDLTGKSEPFTIEKLLEKLPDEHPDMIIERDVEDGYRYEDYDVILISEDYVVFC